MVRVEEESGDLNAWLWNVFLSVLVFMFIWIVVAFITMFKQETKSFRRVNVTRLLIFTSSWMVLSFIFSFVSLSSFIFGGWKKVQKSAHYFSGVTAKVMCFLTIGEIVIRGKENLPSEDTPCILIANHQSCIDVAAVYLVGLNFRWVAKLSSFCIPGVGFLMFLSGHVPLLRRTKRGNLSSKSHMLKVCHNLLKDGNSVSMFPQGTRDRHNLLDFKHGAFTLAIGEKVPIVPMSIDLPSDLWFNSETPPMMTIHPPIYPDDPAFKEKDALKKKCFRIVIGALSYGPEMLKAKEKYEKEQKLGSRQDEKKLV